ncbi:hypothetical protein ACFQZS_09550 [Mucilaginibacter calamicampi]|uniref:Uncharacterized protein n=1 Tax=Mucilaginibacter calamicampi TaxID=1302352 RepID=A0ABW2YXM9_9SPHI
MKKFLLPCLMVFYCMIFGNKAIAQIVENNEQLNSVAENIVTTYQKNIGPQSRLYRGPAYEFYDQFAAGTPYYSDSQNFTNGTVKYDGIVYKNIPLLYDEYRQVLVTFLYDKTSNVALLSDFVNEFDLRGHHFIRVVPDENNKKMDIFFYDELYNNKLQLLVKREKSREAESLSLKTIFVNKNTYYLKKGQHYYTVNSKGQLLNVLNDKKKELKLYIKKNIDFSDLEMALTSVISYYDKISN